MNKAVVVGAGPAGLMAAEVMSQAGLYPADLDWRQAFTTQYLPGRG